VEEVTSADGEMEMSLGRRREYGSSSGLIFFG
jgi:hypothetical protein